MIIHVADFYRVYREHQVYNMTMLDILSKFPATEEISFLAHEGQIAFTQAEYPLQSGVPIYFIPAHVHPSVGGIHWLYKIFYELKNAFALLRKAGPEDLIFFCSLSPVTSFFFKILKKLYPSKKVIITLHGDLDFIQQNKAKLRNLLGKFFAWSFNIKDKKTKYLVLSEGIKQNLIREQFLDPHEIFAINHPYVFDEYPILPKPPGRPLHIGHIGVASVEKNTQLIFELATLLKDEIEAGKVEFSIIGLSENIHAFRNNLVNYSNEQKMLSKEVFNQKLSTLDYAIFFYSDQNYKFCSSGAILDAINHKIPVLSMNNQGFKAIFDEADGDIGVLVDDLPSMANTIRNIINEPDSVAYATRASNLGRYQRKYTTEFVSKQLLEQINTFLHES